MWGGDDPACTHDWSDLEGYTGHRGNRGQVPQTKWQSNEQYPQQADTTAAPQTTCSKCGAWSGQLGLEPTPQLYVEHLVEVFEEIRRVLRPDGICWLNLGDTYFGSSRPAAKADPKAFGSLKPKDMVGIPWRVAFGLQDAGWWLRSDVIWCLSGGTRVYARTQKGEMPTTVKDLARLNPGTVQLWNGQKWTRLLGISVTPRQGDEIEMVLRSGERISCTPGHEWPTDRGLVAARDLVLGDILETTVLPEPDHPRDADHVGQDAAWFVGLFLAEGSWSEDTIQITGHAKEEDRWVRVQQIVRDYGGSATCTVAGNKMDIRVYGKMLVALIQHFLTGRTAKNKGLDAVVWRYSNVFLDALLDGYLHGDAHDDLHNSRWRLGFCRNYKLERDLRTLSARLGYTLTLNTSFSTCDGKKFPSFRGELRKNRTGHWNEKSRSEVLVIRKARCPLVYDLGVAGEPHLFALASGVLTHNSKANPMPSSVTDRPTKAHEYIFLLTKQANYFYDHHAIREPFADVRQGKDGGRQEIVRNRGVRTDGFTNPRSPAERKPSNVDPSANGGRNKRTVWNVNPKPYPGAHFAVWPEELVEPMIKAGSSEHGCCAECRAPFERVLKVVGTVRHKWGTSDQSQMDARLATTSGGKEMPGIREGIQQIKQTTGWKQTCVCKDPDVIRCLVLDPFSGSATTGAVAMRLGRDYVGMDLQLNYFDLAEARLQGRKAPNKLKDEGPDLISDLFG